MHIAPGTDYLYNEYCKIIHRSVLEQKPNDEYFIMQLKPSHVSLFVCLFFKYYSSANYEVYLLFYVYSTQTTENKIVTCYYSQIISTDSFGAA